MTPYLLMMQHVTSTACIAFEIYLQTATSLGCDSYPSEQLLCLGSRKVLFPFLMSLKQASQKQCVLVFATSAICHDDVTLDQLMLDHLPWW